MDDNCRAKWPRKSIADNGFLSYEEADHFVCSGNSVIPTSPTLNFASQAVIAIENTRLLNELRESLDRQTATADILRVIAGTPEDSKRALDTIAETAARMFNATNVNFRRIEGNVLRVIGAAGPTAAKVREVLPDFPLEPTDLAVRSVFDNRQIHIEDRRAILPNERGEIARALRDLPLRSQAFTPLSRQGEAIGVMIVTRSEVRPFQQSELDLMTGFADQAVIAIENARLLNELRQSLQQQTADGRHQSVLKYWRLTGRGEAFCAHVVAYADDFVILSRGCAAEALAWTKAVMTRLGLTVNEAKTSLTNARQERFDFLGYSFGPHRYKANGLWYLSASPSKKSVQQFKTKVGNLLVPGNNDPWPEVRDTLNRSLLGWSNYFCHGTCRSAFRGVDQYVYERVRDFLARRHKMAGRGTKRFSRDVVYGERGLLRLERLPLTAPSCAMG